MLFERSKADIQRDLDYSIITGHHQIKILAILRSNLPEFSQDFRTLPAIPQQDVNITYEDYISQELSFFLNNKVNQTDYLFQFQAIGPDIVVRQFGVGVHSLTLLFIEAKRLRSESSKDYVKTGIRRFKTEKHGKNHDIAAMLGYVQENNFSHWHGKVNSWILALVSDTSETPKWTTEEQINEIHITDIGEYQSTHSRITEEPITLHHFWIDLCNRTPEVVLN